MRITQRNGTWVNLSQEVCRATRGDLGESEVGKGSTFSFTLPREHRRQADAIVEEKQTVCLSRRVGADHSHSTQPVYTRHRVKNKNSDIDSTVFD